MIAVNMEKYTALQQAAMFFIGGITIFFFLSWGCIEGIIYLNQDSVAWGAVEFPLVILMGLGTIGSVVALAAGIIFGIINLVRWIPDNIKKFFS